MKTDYYLSCHLDGDVSFSCVVTRAAMSESGLRMGEWNNRRQWSMEVGVRRQ
jgi:hypothetical protein